MGRGEKQGAGDKEKEGKWDKRWRMAENSRICFREAISVCSDKWIKVKSVIKELLRL